MPTFYGAIDLTKNELRNVVAQNLGAAPATPLKGQFYMNTTDNTLYWYDGAQWIAAKGGAGAVPSDAAPSSILMGDGAGAGVSDLFSRGDHKHGIVGLGTVQPETSFGLPSSNGSGPSVSAYDHKHGTPLHDGPAHSALPISTFAPSVSPGIDMNTFPIINLPMTPTGMADAASKNYVDLVSQGLSWKDSVRLATTDNIVLSGHQTIDGFTTVTNDRVLVKNQTDPIQNGIYMESPGTWQRAADASNTSNELLGASMFVEEGTTQADTAWICTTDAPMTVGTTPLAFAQFGAGAAYSAGAGLTLVGNMIDVVPGDTSLTVNADEMHVNTAVIASVESVAAALAGLTKKFVAVLTGTASPEIVTHNLNTRDILLMVMNGASPYTAVEVDWDATSVNTATVRYSPNLGVGYNCVVVG